MPLSIPMVLYTVRDPGKCQDVARTGEHKHTRVCVLNVVKLRLHVGYLDLHNGCYEHGLL